MIADMPDLAAIPIPGSARARLIDAGIRRFQELGYERAGVTEIAAEAGVTTGSLYHHFKNKLGLYLVIRDEMETRMTERMEGAAAALGGSGRPAIEAGLDVAFDAAVRFGVTRILAEPSPDQRPDAIAGLLAELLPPSARPAGTMLAAAWRAALLSVADGVSPAAAKAGMRWILSVPTAS
jgi:AcrR family transcriptional regulator